MDFYAGLSLGLVGQWQADVVYTQYMSPNDTFSTVKELALSLAFDDSERMGALALAPYVMLAIEASGNAAGIDSGAYLELGVEPGLPLEDSPVSLTFPVTLGLSLSDYYQTVVGMVAENDAFGYFDLGLVASVPLLVNESYGSWEVSGGVHLLFLGDSLEALNAGDQFSGHRLFRRQHRLLSGCDSISCRRLTFGGQHLAISRKTFTVLAEDCDG